jgi:hypothetical protein
MDIGPLGVSGSRGGLGGWARRFICRVEREGRKRSWRMAYRSESKVEVKVKVNKKSSVGSIILSNPLHRGSESQNHPNITAAKAVKVKPIAMPIHGV